MNTIKKILIFALILIVPIYSCDENNDEFTGDVDQDRSNVEISLSALVDMISNIQNGEALEAMTFIMEIINPVNINKNTKYGTWYEVMWDKLGDLINGESILDDWDYDHKFYFSEHVGRYTYDISTETWSKTASNEMIFEFPSSSTVDGNDLTFTIESYSDIQITPISFKELVESDDYWFPTAFKVHLKKNGVKIIEFILNNATWETTIGYPTNIGASILFDPAYLTIDYAATVPGLYKYEIDLVANDNQNELGVDLALFSEIEIFSNLFEDQTTKVDENPYSFLESVTVTAWLNDLEITATIDTDLLIETIMGSEIPTLETLNAIMDAEVLYDNEKIGDIQFLQVEEEYAVCLVYRDGSYDKIDDLLQDFYAELSAIID